MQNWHNSYDSHTLTEIDQLLFIFNLHIIIRVIRVALRSPGVKFIRRVTITSGKIHYHITVNSL